MGNDIRHKRSATPSAIPVVGDLELGELAVNTYDGKLFLKLDDGAESIVEIGSGDVTKVGTPAQYEFAVWTGDGTLEGNDAIVLNGSGTIIASRSIVITSPAQTAAAITLNLPDIYSASGINVICSSTGNGMADCTNFGSNFTGDQGIGIHYYAGSNANVDATVILASNNAANTRDMIELTNSGTGSSIDIDDTGASTANAALSVNANNTARTAAVAEIIQDHASSTADALVIRQDGTGAALTITGAESVFAASTTLYSSLNIPEGVAPTAPVDGDHWLTAAGEYFVRLNGVSVDLTAGGGLFSEDGSRNIIGGTNAGAAIAAATDSFFAGYDAGKLVEGGAFNMAIGSYALDLCVSGANNTAVGYNALTKTTGSSNIAMGRDAGYSITTGAQNIAIGHQALGHATPSSTGTNNIAIGFQSIYGTAITTAANNIALGWDTMPSITTGFDNIVMGQGSGDALTSSSNNVLIGASAGNDLTGAGASGNVMIGPSAGIGVISSSRNIALGQNALGQPNGDAGGDNISIGYQSMYSGVITTSALYNIVIGTFSTYGLTSGTNNISMGRFSTIAMTSGAYNIALGTYAGSSITTGSNNVMIGGNVSAGAGPTTNQSNQLYIHNAESDTPLIHGNFSTPAVTINGTLTTTGAFTSIGIDDNASGERLAVTDSILFLGDAAINYSIRMTSNDKELAIYGGSAGAHITLTGSTHANAYDFIIDGNGDVIRWDESAGDLEILTGVGAKTAALTIDASQDVAAEHYLTVGSGASLSESRLKMKCPGAITPGVSRWAYGDSFFVHNILNAAETLGSAGYRMNFTVLNVDEHIWYTGSSSVSATLDATGLTIADNLDVQGAFTSLGIDDNATVLSLTVADAKISIGQNTASFVTLARSHNDGYLGITGGQTATSGSNMLLYGGGHANAGDMNFRSVTNVWQAWDESVGDWEIRTGVGAKTLALNIDSSQNATFAGDVDVEGAFTSLGIDDNATGERLAIKDAEVDFGSSVSGSTYGIGRPITDGRLAIGGSTSWGSGASILMGGSTHATEAHDMTFYADGWPWMHWDESVGDIEISTGIGAKTTALTIDSSQSVIFGNDTRLADSQIAYFGTSDDLLMYFNGTNGIIQNQGGGFFINQRGNAELGYLTADDTGGTNRNCVIWGGADPDVQLLWDGSERLLTTESGVQITGNQWVTGHNRAKEADETVNNSATIQTDDWLLDWAIDANSWYKITGYLEIEIKDASDFKCDFTFSQTVVEFGGVMQIDNSIIPSVSVTGATGIVITTSGTTTVKVQVSIFFQSHATLAGTLDFEWAQNSAVTEDTILNKGSFLSVEKMA